MKQIVLSTHTALSDAPNFEIMPVYGKAILSWSLSPYMLLAQPSTKMVSLLKYLKEEHNQTLTVRWTHELGLRGLIVSEMNWSEIKAAFLEKKAMI